MWGYIPLILSTEDTISFFLYSRSQNSLPILQTSPTGLVPLMLLSPPFHLSPGAYSGAMPCCGHLGSPHGHTTGLAKASGPFSASTTTPFVTRHSALNMIACHVPQPPQSERILPWDLWPSDKNCGSQRGKSGLAGQLIPIFLSR